MEKKEKKKCCSYIQSARLSTQTKLALIVVSLIFIILNVGSMILNIYLINSFTYKEIYKLVDLDEFNELTFAENNLENIQLQFENTFKNTLLSIVNLYKELSNQTLKDDFYKVKNKDFNISFWDGINYQPQFDPKTNMIFTCDNSETSCIDIDSDNYNFYTYFGLYLQTILYNKKIFMNSHENERIMHLLIICDFDNKENEENNISFYYPAYTNELRKLNVNIIKEYVLKKIIQKINSIAMFQNTLPNNLEFYDNLFLLPFYDDKDNDGYSFSGYNLTFEILNEEFVSNNSDLKINEVAFMIVPKRKPNSQEFLDINLENINENIAQIFLLVGLDGSSEIIFEKLNNQHSGLYLLRTDYLFPYELISKGSCKKVLRIGDTDKNKYVDLTKLNYLDDCLDKKIKINKFKEYYSTYDKLIEDFSIFRNNISNNYNYNLVKLYRSIEQNYLQSNLTSYSKTLTKVSSINNEDFKIKKTYSPLNIIYQINYFYPIDNIKMDILIKSEDYRNEILKESKRIMKRIIIAGTTILILCVIILELIILVILRYFTEELNKPLDIINNSQFITGQIKEEEEYENKSKSLKKANIISDKKIHIDEFKELITSVSEALKSETEFKQKINKQDEDDMKLEMEYLNKEFEKNKIFNIMVDENKINNILEESNYSNEIIKHKTNIDNVKNDSFVKKSYLFREYVHNDEFEELDNSGEDSMAIYNNTIFKDENTLQNPNSLFYNLFKTAFDESYVKRIEEMKLKKENEKKKKLKKNNYTFRSEDESTKDKNSKINYTKGKKFIYDFERNNTDISNEGDFLKNKEKNDNYIKYENEVEDKLNNILNEENFLKSYTDGTEDKKEEDLLIENNKKDIDEEEIDTTK